MSCFRAEAKYKTEELRQFPAILPLNPLSIAYAICLTYLHIFASIMIKILRMLSISKESR